MNIKKLISIILALVIALGSVIPAFADDVDTAESTTATQTESESDNDTEASDIRQTESEPNNDIESADNVFYGDKVHGTLSDSDDIDCFKFKSDESTDFELDFSLLDGDSYVVYIVRENDPSLPVVTVSIDKNSEYTFSPYYYGDMFNVFYAIIKPKEGSSHSDYMIGTVGAEYDIVSNVATQLTKEETEPDNNTPFGAINLGRCISSSEKGDVDFYQVDLERFVFQPSYNDSNAKWTIKIYNEYGTLIDTRIVQNYTSVTIHIKNADNKSLSGLSDISEFPTAFRCFISSLSSTFIRKKYDFNIYYISVSSESTEKEDYNIGLNRVDMVRDFIDLLDRNGASWSAGWAKFTSRTINTVFKWFFR